LNRRLASTYREVYVYIEVKVRVDVERRPEVNVDRYVNLTIDVYKHLTYRYDYGNVDVYAIVVGVRKIVGKPEPPRIRVIPRGYASA
jgi:hypothetical protein